MSEKELVNLLKKGDRDAFNILIEQYQGKVYNIAVGMLNDQEDALDASQEVFINIYRGVGSFKENSSLSTWIYRVCANVCKDFLRKRMRKANVISLDSKTDDDEPMQIPDDAPTPERISEQTELQRRVREAMDQLSNEYKEVLVLCDIEGLSYEEISKILKIPEGTVKSRINRARQALRKKISENRELFFQ